MRFNFILYLFLHCFFRLIRDASIRAPSLGFDGSILLVTTVALKKSDGLRFGELGGKFIESVMYDAFIKMGTG